MLAIDDDDEETRLYCIGNIIIITMPFKVGFANNFRYYYGVSHQTISLP